MAGAGALEFATLDAGSYHACGILQGGEAYCWGFNNHGQLGIGTAAGPTVCRGSGANTDYCSLKPVAVNGGHTFNKIAAGFLHSCALTPDGSAYCWGMNNSGQLGTGRITGPEMCGGYHCSTQPVAVLSAVKFVDIHAGIYHTCALTLGGSVYCWGHNAHGELGTGTDILLSPVPVPAMSTVPFQAVTTEGFHTCALSQTGAAYCWGANFSGELGTGNTVSSNKPVAVVGGLTFNAISASGGGTWDHTCALTGGGAAYCWGGNAQGQLGNGTKIGSTRPVRVAGGITFRAISSGWLHTCALTRAHAAYCWGGNDDGQLGNGTRTTSTRPVRVAGGITFRAIRSGWQHTCALTSRLPGAGYCWGGNWLGQRGSGNKATSTKPVLVAAP